MANRGRRIFGGNRRGGNIGQGTVRSRQHNYVEAASRSDEGFHEDQLRTFTAGPLRLVAVRTVVKEESEREKERRKMDFTDRLQSACDQLKIRLELEEHTEEEDEVRSELSSSGISVSSDCSNDCTPTVRSTVRVDAVTREKEQWILQVQLSSRSFWQNILFKLATKVLVDMKENDTKDETPLLTVHSLDFFPLQCSPANMSVVTRSISFGVILSHGVRDTHFRMETGKMLTSFLYSESKIMILYEPHKDRKYKIKFMLDSIRRIIVDSTGEEDFIERRLILSISSPPKVSVSDKKMDENEEWNCKEEWTSYEYSTIIDCSDAFSDCTSVVFDLDDCPEWKLYNIIARLRHKTAKCVEMSSMEEVLMMDEEGEDGFKVSPYKVTTPFDGNIQRCIHETCWKKATEVTRTDKNSPVTRELYNAIRKRTENQCFVVQALLEGIVQRGRYVKNQLLVRWDAWNTFVELVIDLYKRDDKATVSALNRMLIVLSEEICGQTVAALLETEFHLMEGRGEEEVQEKPGTVKVHKVLVTTTKKMYMGVEESMENRVLRRYSETGMEIIRISFRDDRGELLHSKSVGKQIIENLILDTHNGIELGGRRYIYLGNSNSQVREQGAFFIHNKINVSKIRRELGLFENLENIPRYMARFGQCFTQARSSQIEIKTEEAGVIAEIIGGEIPERDGKPYTFSDGVGSISHEMAQRITDDLGWPRVPTAIQIRHRGEKGMLCVDRMLDQRNELRRRMLRTDENGNSLSPFPDLHVLVRPSMAKFELNTSNHSAEYLELVKSSQPAPLFLNRPFLNILDQLSEKQKCNHRVTSRIEELMQNDITEAFKTLLHEDKAQDVIRERITFPMMAEMLDKRVEITTEPFLRSLIQATVRLTMCKLQTKSRIQIPSSLGRMLFGVVDTTGQLQSGQVFVAVSRNVERKGGSMNNVQQMTLTGTILVTKNPCHVAGDARLFEAVDVPELVLQGLSDVIVFPHHGPRPHPDEMAGSDLDGDEYCVIWDPRLYFDHNEPAMQFPSSDPNKNWPINPFTLSHDLSRYSARTVSTGHVGEYASAHIAHTDLFGIESPVGHDIAVKISKSLDFPKSGNPPDELRTEDVVLDDGTFLPAEKPFIKPDFMQRPLDPTYKSKGVLGRMHRDMERYIIAMETTVDEIKQFPLDAAIDIPDWEKYKNEAESDMKLYNYKLKSVMETYGIESEAELCSGAILKTRFLEREEELERASEMSEEKLHAIVAEARIRFFESLCNWRTDLDHLDSNRTIPRSNPNILDLMCKDPTTEMKKKAVAMYRVAYEHANEEIAAGDKSKALISFPWIVYDVIAAVRQDHFEEEKHVCATVPLAKKLDALVTSYALNPMLNGEIAAFKNVHMTGESMTARMLKETTFLPDLCLLLVKWAHHSDVFNDNRFKEEHLIALICLFGLRTFSRGYEYISIPTEEERQLTKSGEYLIEFMQFISSGHFRDLKVIKFQDLGLQWVLMRGEHLVLHKAAVPSFAHLMFAQRLDVPIPGESVPPMTLKEMKPLAVLLPGEVLRSPKCMEFIKRVLRRLSGVVKLSVWSDLTKKRVLISAIGTEASFFALRNFLIFDPPSREAMQCKGASELYANLMWERIRERGTEHEQKGRMNGDDDEDMCSQCSREGAKDSINTSTVSLS